ncbi:TonB-dependent receptor domain-containing protein [Robiginitalea sp. SC105]|uniref:TonB-dependent receptor family protein n=1 Tax=Robiginitalea sp. SC105 TaxID=2762332 RepID=UPI0016395836|nr:TonB-dependent receptor [Robiginitalea sp. SC105]MBC2837991.1 TonB-dependent receptor [Robiginitalea sp. SC105]
MKHILFLLVFSTVCLAYGQDQPRDSVIDLNEVILQVERTRESPLGLTPSEVVTARAIRQQNPVDFAGTMNQVPGVYFLSGALNTNRITIRGVGARTPFGTDKLRMYFNGIPVTNGTGVSSLESFDLENLSSIRVVKGPKSAAYGGALGGALLLRSDPAGQPGTQFRTRTSVGSYGLFKSNVALTHADSTVSAEIRYNRLTTQGYRENNAFQRDGLLLNLGMDAGRRHRLNLLANYIDYSAEIPSSLNRTDFETDPTQAAFTWAQAKGFEANKYTLLGLSDHYALSGNTSLVTSVFFNYLDHYEPRPFNILDEFTFGFGLRAVLETGFRIGDMPVQGRLGAELYRDEYSWGTYENLYEDNAGQGSLQGAQISRNKEFRRQDFLFGSLDWEVSEAIGIRLGLGLNNTRYDFRDRFNKGPDNRSAGRDFDPILLPSLDMRYTWRDTFFSYLNISRGFSNPSLEESLSPEGLINPDIGQEKGWNYEAGLHWESVDSRMQITAALYRMEIRDLLVAQRVGQDQYIGRNAGSTRHNGMEVSWEYRLRPGRDFTVTPFVSYTLNAHRFREFTDQDRDYSGNRLTGVPRNRLYSGIRLSGDAGWYLNGSYQYVDPIPLTDSNSVFSDAYGLVNLQAGYNWALGSRFRAGLELGVNNLLDTLYASSVLINATGFGGSQPRYYYPGNSRNYYLGVLVVGRL